MHMMSSFQDAMLCHLLVNNPERYCCDVQPTSKGLAHLCLLLSCKLACKAYNKPIKQVSILKISASVQTKLAIQ